MKAKFSLKEIEVLKEALRYENRPIPTTFSQQNDVMYLDITEDQILDYEQCCEEYLLYAGFDAEYELTSKGKVTENLIDKFEALQVGDPLKVGPSNL